MAPASTSVPYTSVRSAVSRAALPIASSMPDTRSSASFTRTVNAVVPPDAGVPLIVPSAARVRPGGNVPSKSANVYGGVPPDPLSVARYGWFVMGLGSLDYLKDGRDVYDNAQLIYRYPQGRTMTYSSISTNQFLPFFNGQRSEMGEMIIGTEGAIEITVGDGPNNYEPKGSPCIAWWYREPPKETRAIPPALSDIEH